MRKTKGFRWQFLLVGMMCLQLLIGFGQPAKAAGKDDEFRIAMEAGYQPFNWSQDTDANGAVKIEGGNEYAGGYDVEIGKIIAEKLGKKLVVVKVEWDGLTPALQSGKADAIIAGMSPTAERRKAIDFTDVYYKSDLVMVVRRGSKYENASSIYEFAGAKITGQLNTFHYTVIDQIPKVKKMTAMDNFSAMRVALEAGKIDGYVTERPEGVTAERANQVYKMVEFKAGDGFNASEEDTAIAIGLKKNSPLREPINQILAGISDSERKTLMNRAIDNQPTTEKQQGIWDKMVSIFKQNWRRFFSGAGMTLLVSITGTLIGLFIGMLIGVIRTIPKSTKKAMNAVKSLVNFLFTVYIEVFRGTPMIVQAMVIYYGIDIVFGIDMNKTLAGIFIVSINTGAYMAEIVRGGIYAVDRGQFEAAQAIGMTHFQTMKNIVIPQVFRNILPATGNEFVINIKDTSVLNVISVTELYFEGKTVAGTNYEYFATFFVIAAIYLVLTFTITRLLRLLEKHIDGPDSYHFANQNQVTDPKELLKEGV